MPRGKKVWVAVEIRGGAGSALFRGSIAARDLAALLRGTFRRPFVGLDDVHWADTVSGRTEVTAYGRDGLWRWHTGVMHVRPENVLTIAELVDGSALSGPRRGARRRRL